MSETERFESAARSYDNYTWIGRDGVKRAIDRLKAAHDREIRDVSQQYYHRGFAAGKHSMDAEHRAVAMRLRGLRFDGGSHENLSRVAYAIYPCATGWMCESADGLRDRLIDLMGGVSDENVHVGGLRCDDGCMGDVSNGKDTGRTHDSPSNLDRNHMAVRVGVDTVIGDSDDTCCCAGGGACTDCDGGDSGEHEEVTDERLADDCAVDSRGGDGGGDLHMAGVTYDPLWNERHEAVRVLRKLLDRNTSIWNTEISIALGLNIFANNAAVCRRLIHLLGGDQPSGIDVLREMDEREAEGRITDELCEWISEHTNSPKGFYEFNNWDVAILHGIAGRIDEQFDRICQQQEAVLQSIIDEVVEERKSDQLRIEKLEAECEELSKKLEVIREYGVEIADAAGGGYEVYNKAAQERDELQAKLDAIRDALDG